jgi:hypothetical protein
VGQELLRLQPQGAGRERSQMARGSLQLDQSGSPARQMIPA